MRVSILINDMYPSNVHLQVSKIMDVDEADWPPVSFISDQLSGCSPSDAIPRRLQRILKMYVEESHQQRSAGLQHSSVVGAVNPAGPLLSGRKFYDGSIGNATTRRWYHEDTELQLGLVSKCPRVLLPTHRDLPVPLI